MDNNDTQIFITAIVPMNLHVQNMYTYKSYQQNRIKSSLTAPMLGAVVEEEEEEGVEEEGEEDHQKGEEGEEVDHQKGEEGVQLKETHYIIIMSTQAHLTL